MQIAWKFLLLYKEDEMQSAQPCARWSFPFKSVFQSAEIVQSSPSSIVSHIYKRSSKPKQEYLYISIKNTNSNPILFNPVKPPLYCEFSLLICILISIFYFWCCKTYEILVECFGSCSICLLQKKIVCLILPPEYHWWYWSLKK